VRRRERALLRQVVGTVPVMMGVVVRVLVLQR